MKTSQWHDYHTRLYFNALIADTMSSEEASESKSSSATRRKKKFDSSFKAKVALAAIMSGKTLSELAVIYEVHPTQISQWKSQLINHAEIVFSPNPQIRRSIF